MKNEVTCISHRCKARPLCEHDLQKPIAQARAIAEFKPPKDKEPTPEEQQETIKLSGLKQTKKKSQPSKKRRKQGRPKQ